MSYQRLLLPCMLGMFCASPAWAQLEEIIVTGARVNGEDYSRMPAIVVERRADFLVQRIRLMQQIRAHNEMTRLRIGQMVTFTDSAGQVLRGTITRHNRKSVTIVTQSGEQWRVAPQFVQAG